LRNPLAWRLVAAFFFMSFVFYGLNSWLPDAYVERGWSDSSAGALIAVLNAVTIPCGFFIAWAADHWGTRRLWLGGAAAGDLSGGFDAVLWVLVAAGAVLVVLDSSFSPARLAAARSSAEPPLRAASS